MPSKYPDGTPDTGIILGGIVVPLAGIVVVTHRTAPQYALKIPGDGYRYGRHIDVERIIMHRTMGDEPDRVVPGAGPASDIAERNATCWRRSKRPRARTSWWTSTAPCSRRAIRRTYAPTERDGRAAARRNGSCARDRTAGITERSSLPWSRSRKRWRRTVQSSARSSRSTTGTKSRASGHGGHRARGRTGTAI